MEKPENRIPLTFLHADRRTVCAFADYDCCFIISRCGAGSTRLHCHYCQQTSFRAITCNVVSNRYGMNLAGSDLTMDAQVAQSGLTGMAKSLADAVFGTGAGSSSALSETKTENGDKDAIGERVVMPPIVPFLDQPVAFGSPQYLLLQELGKGSVGVAYGDSCSRLDGAWRSIRFQSVRFRSGRQARPACRRIH